MEDLRFMPQNPNLLIVSIAFFLLLTLKDGQPARAQFIDIILDVDSQVTSQAVQTLSFGTFQTNSGQKRINLGDVNMGVFSIRVLENQLLLVSLKKPVALHHLNPAIDEVIPLQLSAQYGYSVRNYENSFALYQSSTPIIIAKDNSAGPWNKLYIFLYGIMDIRDIPNGIYTNDLFLNIVYL